MTCQYGIFRTQIYVWLFFQIIIYWLKDEYYLILKEINKSDIYFEFLVYLIFWELQNGVSSFIFIFHSIGWKQISKEIFKFSWAVEFYFKLVIKHEWKFVSDILLLFLPKLPNIIWFRKWRGFLPWHYM